MELKLSFNSKEKIFLQFIMFELSYNNVDCIIVSGQFIFITSLPHDIIEY